MSEVKSPKEFFERLSSMFANGSSGYYLSVGDWKLAAPYVLDLQDVAGQLAAAQAEIARLQYALDVAVEELEKCKSKSDTVINPAMTRSTFDMKLALNFCYDTTKSALDKIKQIKNSTQ